VFRFWSNTCGPPPGIHSNHFIPHHPSLSPLLSLQTLLWTPFSAQAPNNNLHVLCGMTKYRTSAYILPPTYRYCYREPVTTIVCYKFIYNIKMVYTYLITYSHLISYLPNYLCTYCYAVNTTSLFYGTYMSCLCRVMFKTNFTIPL